MIKRETDGQPLPESDGTIDLEKREAELRFLKAIRNAKAFTVKNGQLVPARLSDLAAEVVPYRRCHPDLKD